MPKNIRLFFYALFHYKNSKLTKALTIAFNHSSDIDFKDFINLYKKCTAKPYSFLVIDATLTSDNVLERVSEKEYKN